MHVRRLLTNPALSPTRIALTKKSEAAKCPMRDTRMADTKHLMRECERLAIELEGALNCLKTGRHSDTFEGCVRELGTEDYQQGALKCLLNFICDAGISICT